MPGTLLRDACGRGIYVALLASAVLVNAAGYLLKLWHEETVFDEAVHFYTTFALVTGAGRLAVPRWLLHRRLPRWWFLLLGGTSLGLAWEAFEWTVGIIGGPRDTVVDLLMDTAGAAVAATLVVLVEKRGPS